MKSHILLTCGTSALGGYNHFGKILRQEEADRVKFAGPKMLAVDENADLAALTDEIFAEWTRAGRLKEAKDFQHVSAEISSIFALQKRGLLADNGGATLLHTGTPDGIFAARIAASVLESSFEMHVRRVSIPDLDVSNPARMRHGMAETMHVISSQLRQYDPSSALFSPIGGYKVMTALAYAVASVHGYGSVYLHESGQVVHTIPPVPIRIDGASLADLAPLVRRMLLQDGGFMLELPDNAPEWDLVERYRWFFESEDGIITPNAFGLYVFGEPTYQKSLWPKVLVNPQLSKNWSVLEPTVRSVVEKIVRAFQRGDGNRSNTLFHEQEYKGLKSPGAQWHLCKVPREKERFLWQVEPQTGALYFGKYWTDHASYDRDVRGALIEQFDANGKFEDVSARLYDAQ